MERDKKKIKKKYNRQKLQKSFFPSFLPYPTTLWYLQHKGEGNREGSSNKHLQN